MPVARPFRIWLKSSAKFTWRSDPRRRSRDHRRGPGLGLEGSYVFTRGVFGGQRRRSRRDDVGEVHGVLHRLLLLAPHEEVRPQRLVGLWIHAHLAYEILDLEPFAGL